MDLEKRSRKSDHFGLVYLYTTMKYALYSKKPAGMVSGYNVCSSPYMVDLAE